MVMTDTTDRSCGTETDTDSIASTILAPGKDQNERHRKIEEHALREQRSRLFDRLLNESPTAELVHLLLITVVAALIWSRVPNSAVYIWVSAVVIVTGSRFLLRRHFCSAGETVERVYRAMRVTILFSGLVWGSGVLLLSPSLGHEELALILVVFAGLVAGATSTLVADRISFQLFTTATLLPLAAALMVSGTDRFHLIATLLTVLFWIIVAVIHRRSHDQLARHLEASVRLELSDILLETERNRLQAFFDRAPIAIAMVDRDSIILDINPGFTAIFGYERSEAVGQDLNLLIVPEDEIEEARGYDRLVAEDEATIIESHRKSKTGELVPVQASAIHSKAGPEALTFVIYDDISRIKEAQNALDEVEMQYRKLVESASDMVWEIDLEGKWIFLNTATEDILGTSRDMLLGRSFEETIDPTMLSAATEKFQLVLRGEELTDFETVFLGADGESLHLSFAARPILDSHGAIAGARGIARDVSARVRSREALEEARQAAEQMALTRTSFLANMSHEIRTPMNGILGMTELLLDSDLAPEQRNSAQLVRTSADALLRIINDILDFSKIESGQFSIEEIPFELAAVVESTLRTFAIPAFEKRIELVSDINNDIPDIVIGDPGRLRQVLNNLIGNAVKFTHSGEIVVAVKKVTEVENHVSLEFTVRDTGIGIPEEKREHIFEEFSQADVSTTRQHGGTGLGLAISNGIVNLMGGNISVVSAVGEGSEFSFILPLGVGEGYSRTSFDRHRIALSGVRSIVIDDNATNRRIVREMLGAMGISVDEAEDADSGLTRLHHAMEEGAAYDLAVIDGYMPGRDGFELAEIIRADPVLKDTLMMLLTSGARKGDGQRCREIGVQAYLTKPVSRTDLLEATVVVLTEIDEQRPASSLVTRHSIEETRQHRLVLLAEDNPVNQKVASTMLRKRGHSVEVVENGVEAVEAVKQTGYDIVLMDIQMPTMDGLEAVRAIRDDPRFEELPIIALTAHALEGDEERFLEAGMNGYLSKPFRPHELYAIVEEWTADSVGRTSEDPESGTDAPPVDLDSFRETMREAGAEDAVESMLELFLDDAPGRMEDLLSAASNGDAVAISKAAHAYKSAAATIGAADLASTLNAIEAQAKEDDIQGAVSRIDRAREEHIEALDYLREQRR